MNHISKVLKYSTIILFISYAIWLLFWSSKINFLHNDDWVFTRSAISFSNLDFSQTPIEIFGKSAPLFYVQGILGGFFVKVFGVENLPTLTGIISVLSIFILFKIINNFYLKNHLFSSLVTALIALNPIFIYSSLGFMTENYFILFLLISIYFFEKFKLSNSNKNFLLINVSMLLSFFVRQFGIFISGALIVHLLFTKQYKKLLIQVFITGLMLVFYWFYYYAGNKYSYSGINSESAFNIYYYISVVFAFFIYLGTFIYPLIVNNFITEKLLSIKNIFLLVASAIFIYILYTIFFSPDLLFWGEFPYLGNTLYREGFYNGDIYGFKYHFKGFYDIYNFLKLIGFTMLPILLFVSIKNYKKIFSFYGSFIVAYILIMPFMAKVFDRYGLVFFIISILLLLNFVNRIKLILITIFGFFILINVYLNHLYISDFIVSRNLIWEEANKIVQEEKLENNQIHATGTWSKNNMGYDIFTNKVKYLFTYDSPSELDENICCKSLVREYNIEFPLNFFVNPKIYLYKYN